ncbi:MAG: DNA cytosine methyltransferase [Prevotellaceae bacterium]|jgi:DNA (cytosine-5)-methyltransferase 1|nr:DNA cytosine methyltransferase [Prevotellaceae bacterium]
MSQANTHTKSLIGASLFSSAGIAEQYFSAAGIDIVAANELLPERADLYQAQYPKSKMICGNILSDDVFSKVVAATPEKLDFLLASPPCQGMSVAGKNRTTEQMLMDNRNFLVFKIIDFIKIKNPDYILIENVPTFLKLALPYNGKLLKVLEILTLLFGENYCIESEVFDAAEYGVAQRRARAIIKLYKKGRKWGMPEKSEVVTVREKIGNLPSLEAGEKSNVKWHFARKHSPKHIECMRYTPTGKTAIGNSVHFPTKENGERVRAYNTTFRRINWDEPAPTITIRNDAISSQLNVHPGRKKSDDTYSDARVLTPLELMLLSSLPADWNIPDNTPELLIRKCIGECIPPLLTKKIVEQINK